MARAKRIKPQSVGESEFRTVQPGGIGSGAATVSIQPVLFRAGMNAELQKFGNSKRDQQLSLWQADGIPFTGTEVSGLDLTVSEDRALAALQILLDRTDYEGNLPSKDLQTETYQGRVPRLAVSYSDFFEAYGLEPGRDGHHKQELEALEALRSLAETKRRVCYTRHRYNGKERRSDMVSWTAPIIAMETLDIYEDLTDDEAARVQAGEDRPGRRSAFVVTFSSLLVEQIKTFHVLKPTTLHQEIRQCHDGRRVPRSQSLFVEWLLTLDNTPFRISKAKLIERLRLEDLYVRQRRKAYVEKQIEQAIQTALTLEYLTGFQEDGTGMLILHLNPIRCTRVAAKRRRALPEPQ